MSRDDRDRLTDVLAAADAIANHLTRGDISDGLVFDAVRVRLIEIGEAVKDLDPALLALEPDVAWRQVAGMRDHLAHRYFDATHSLVAATVSDDLPHVVSAIQRLAERFDGHDER